MVARDLKAVLPRVSGTAVECRASVCRLRARIPGSSQRDVQDALRFFYGLSGAALPAADDLYLGLRGGAFKSAADALTRLKSRRSTLLYTHRTGRAASKPPFPIERLPPE
jgi:hypothetical protein